MKTVEQIEKEIKNLQEDLKKARQNEAVRSLDEISIEDKTKFFDSLFKHAEGVLETYKENQDLDGDETDWMFGKAITILARDPENLHSFWTYWNSIQKK